jgi:hypothetical protein
MVNYLEVLLLCPKNMTLKDEIRIFVDFYTR